MTEFDEQDDTIDPANLDPAQFRVSGTDSKGHTQRVWVNLQPMHVQTLDTMSHSGWYPYRNRGDFVRHAIIRHVHWLEKIRKPVNSITGALDAMNALLRDAEFRMEFTEYVNQLTKQIQALEDEGDIIAARKLLLETLRHVKSMPDGYWKDKYTKAIQDKNKRLLEMMPNANLLTFNGDE